MNFCNQVDKSGFTKGCIEKAEEMGNVTLVSYADIISVFYNKDIRIIRGKEPGYRVT